MVPIRSALRESLHPLLGEVVPPVQVRIREDVENLFWIDRVPPEARLWYDSGVRERIEPELILLDPVCSGDTLRDVWRAEVVKEILSAKRGTPPLRPFTLYGAHEIMCSRDTLLDSLLVHPDFAPLLIKVVKPWMGLKLKVFVHFDVPDGEVFGLAEPQFVGIAPIQRGAPAAALTNNLGVIWGRFPRARQERGV